MWRPQDNLWWRSSPVCLAEMRVSASLEFTNEAELAGQQTSRIHLSWPYKPGFYVGSGDRTRVLVFEWQALYRWSCLLSSQHIFCIHAISGTGFLSFNFKSPPKGKWGGASAPRSEGICSLGERTFLVVPFALKKALPSRFQIQVCFVGMCKGGGGNWSQDARAV